MMSSRSLLLIVLERIGTKNEMREVFNKIAIKLYMSYFYAYKHSLNELHYLFNMAFTVKLYFKFENFLPMPVDPRQCQNS